MRAVPNNKVRVQPLSGRLAGLPLDDTLYEGTPPHLGNLLRAWVRNFLTEELAHRIAATLRHPLNFGVRGPVASASEELAVSDGTKLLDVIDLALQLDGALHFEVDEGMEHDSVGGYCWPLSSGRAWAVERLAQLLHDGGSAYTVHWRVPPRLVRRVDPTVTAAAEHAVAIADPTTAGLLADAWRQTYGRPPDPTTAYRQAVRAVEQVACPLVLPKDPKATLGMVLHHLRGAPLKWTFILVDEADAGTIDPVVTMFDRLWRGQVSRHGGGRTSRDQTQAEAEAAIHLAVVLIQWLTSGALRRIP